MFNRAIAGILFSILPLAVWAEIEKVAFTCGQQMCFRWWPVLKALPGWAQDGEQSMNYNFNAMAPVGETFATAETVMYANAIYKPRVPEEKTLAAFVASDIAKFRSDPPGLRVERAGKLRTLDGKTAETHWLKPSGKGQWERVAYLEEGEYYLVFVVSSRSERGLLKASPDFEKLVSAYREKP